MQTFKLEIYGESPDGESIKSEIKANLACEKGMAISLIVKLLDHDPNLKILFAEAFMVLAMGKSVSESITDTEYYDRVDKSEENKDVNL